MASIWENVVDTIKKTDYTDGYYTGCAFLFLMALQNFRNPEAAKMGNVFGFLGMTIAIGATVASHLVSGMWAYVYIAAIGGVFAVVGIIMAISVKMTSMPQMVGLLNALGGLAAVFESYALYVSDFEYRKMEVEGKSDPFQVYQAIFYLLSAIIGTITFFGSIVACLKLAGKITSSSVMPPFRGLFTLVLWTAIVVTAVLSATRGIHDMAGLGLLGGCTLLSAVYGIQFVLAIGGADMPVVISILNSLSGWSTLFSGLTAGNSLMVIMGAFVGASGIILSVQMCIAMNRTLLNVMKGGFGGDGKAPTGGSQKLEAHKMDAADVARLLTSAKSIMIVPGYGMAVARAQNSVAQLCEELRKSGKTVNFGVHPVAGRLPGHMNVLLAEANVPYDLIYDLDQSNDRYNDVNHPVDVTIVIGANDTVNPAAVDDSSCGIYGMPVLNVWKSQRVVVVKRSLGSGYAGVENPLFFGFNSSMFLGDSRAVIDDLLTEIRPRLQGDPKSVYAFLEQDDQRVKERIAALNTDDVVAEGSNKEDSTAKFGGPSLDRCVLGILKEPEEDERVAIVPSTAAAIIKTLGCEVVVENGAGFRLGYTDVDYTNVGCRVLPSREEVYTASTMVACVTIPWDVNEARNRKKSVKSLSDQTVTLSSGDHISLPRETSSPIILSAFAGPSNYAERIDAATEIKATVFGMDLMPRITIAQSMDVLSSTAKVAGFRCVIEALSQYGSLPGAEITAAGSYPPAKVLVVGAGVAGLEVVGGFNRLGADVRGFDVRLECKEQIESMGGRFLMMDFGAETGDGGGGYAKPMSPEFIQKEMELFMEQSKECNIFVLTAAIPGRRAPILFKEEHVKAMKRGSILVDLAAATGGNCEVTRPHQTYVTDNGVTIVGETQYVQKKAPKIASEMLSNNILSLLKYMTSKTQSLGSVDLKNEILRAITITHAGRNIFPAPRPTPLPALDVKVDVEREKSDVSDAIKESCGVKMGRRNLPLNSNCNDYLLLGTVGIALGVLIAFSAPISILMLVYLFVLAAGLGYYLVNNVTRQLHTPLMSLTNALSGGVILAAITDVSKEWSGSSIFTDSCKGVTNFDDSLWFCQPRGVAAIACNCLAIGAASINIFGGFAVTQRMLNMFKKVK